MPNPLLRCGFVIGDVGGSTFMKFDEAPYTVEDLAADTVAVLYAWDAIQHYGRRA